MHASYCKTLQTWAFLCKIIQSSTTIYCRSQTFLHLIIYCSFEDILWGWTIQFHLECSSLPWHGAMFFCDVQYTEQKKWPSFWILQVSVKPQIIHSASVLVGFCRWVSQEWDHVSVAEKGSGGGRSAVLETLPVCLRRVEKHFRCGTHTVRWDIKSSYVLASSISLFYMRHSYYKNL